MSTKTFLGHKVTARGGKVYIDGAYIGWYDERNGRCNIHGDDVALPYPANMGTRTVGVDGQMVRKAVEAKVADGLDMTIALGNL